MKRMLILAAVIISVILGIGYVSATTVTDELADAPTVPETTNTVETASVEVQEPIEQVATPEPTITPPVIQEFQWSNPVVEPSTPEPEPTELPLPPTPPAPGQLIPIDGSAPVLPPV